MIFKYIQYYLKVNKNDKNDKNIMEYPFLYHLTPYFILLAFVLYAPVSLCFFLFGHF